MAQCDLRVSVDSSPGQPSEVLYSSADTPGQPSEVLYSSADTPGQPSEVLYSSADTLESSELQISSVQSVEPSSLKMCQVSLERLKARDMVLLVNGHCPATYTEKRRLTWICPFCPYTDNAFCTTNRHVIRQHTKELHFSCEDCGKQFQFRYTYLAHQRQHDEQQKKFPCSYCSRLLLSKNGLEIHEANHIGRKDYPCTFCDKAFSSSYAAKLHMRHHTGERPYACKFCSYLSTSNSGLRSHMRIHTSEQPYKCSFCPRCFSSNANRFAHERRLHTFERPFECPSCDRTFTTKADLNAHMWLHKPARESPYFCADCKRGFYRRHQWEEHAAKCDPSKEVLCEVCDRMVSKNAYSAHFKNMHGDKNAPEKRPVKVDDSKPSACAATGSPLQPSPKLVIKPDPE